MSLNEPFRPQFHFTPARYWMNDPNGLVFYAGEYHLFYQYYPEGTVHGPMHWGHAVSQDLLNWSHLPIALYPDEHGTIFSGSAVIDWYNTAGFGAEAMVAIFTHNSTQNWQSQSLAYSTDRGRTWTKYAGNPVIPTPAGQKDFRDPKVIWHVPSRQWVMVLAVGQQIWFYTSPDLKTWRKSSQFGQAGSTAGVWETPDLFELPVDGGPEARWVLMVSVGNGAPAGGSGTQYFIGRFDGEHFSNEHSPDTVLWLDYGADNYAGQSWSDAPDNRRLMIGWMSNWRYARLTPPASWRGAMTLPRLLRLHQTPAGIRLRQQPLSLESLRQESVHYQGLVIPADAPFRAELGGQALELRADFAVPAGAAAQFGIRLIFAAPEAVVTVGYAGQDNTLFIDRARSGVADFHPDFAARHQVRLEPDGQTLRLHLILDHSSLELFANEGQVAMTEQIFPQSGPVQLEIYSQGGPVTLNHLAVHRLKAAEFVGAGS